MSNLERVDAAIARVDRSFFVPEEFKELANTADEAIPFGTGQTIPNRAITRLMLALLDLQPGDKVLEIGFGSGYQATILSLLCAEVHSLEHRKVAERLVNSVPDNVFVYGNVDGVKSALDKIFDAIIVTAATPGIFATWRSMMKEGSRIVAPVGERGQVCAVRKYEVIDGNLRDLGDYAYGSFVPLYLDGEYVIYKGIRARYV